MRCMVLKAMQPRMSACEAFVERPAAPSVQQRERTTTSQKERKPKKMKKSNSRVIGLDVHPDSFAGAIGLSLGDEDLSHGDGDLWFGERNLAAKARIYRSTMGDYGLQARGRRCATLLVIGGSKQ